MTNDFNGFKLMMIPEKETWNDDYDVITMTMTEVIFTF